MGFAGMGAWALFNLGRCAVEVALLVVLTMLLPLRNVKAYVIVSVVVQACLFIANMFVGSAVLSRFFALISYAVVPFLCFDARAAQRLVAVTLGFVFIFAGEVVASLVWMAISGLPVADFAAAVSRPFETVVMFLTDMAVIALCGALFRLPMRLWVGREDVGMPRFGRFAGFLLLQVLLVIVASLITYDLLGAARPLYAFLAGYAGACIAIDSLLLASMRSYDAALIQGQRAAVLAERLDACLAEYAGAVAQGERAAALRHDLRNHLQVVGALLERGELARAAGYVGEAEKEVRG